MTAHPCCELNTFSRQFTPTAVPGGGCDAEDTAVIQLGYDAGLYGSVLLTKGQVQRLDLGGAVVEEPPRPHAPASTARSTTSAGSWTGNKRAKTKIPEGHPLARYAVTGPASSSASTPSPPPSPTTSCPGWMATSPARRRSPATSPASWLGYPA
ncbi:hypothetical protein GCM10010430_13050 [Kitasatospora cystarginea]|uniref:Uncharacterized protein n=1 Tax=Kitasatospora cystarginea TaxID=58350 RepID=A0ABN3DJT1_9ACTN